MDEIKYWKQINIWCGYDKNVGAHFLYDQWLFMLISLCWCEQSNYGILGTVISALSRSPGAGQAAVTCSRSNSVIVEHATAASPSSQDKLSPSNSLNVDTRHQSLSPAAVAAVRSFYSIVIDAYKRLENYEDAFVFCFLNVLIFILINLVRTVWKLR